MSPGAKRALAIVGSALGGAVIGLLVGLVFIAVAPDNGFGDLAAAAVTTVFLVPLGFFVGGIVGWLVTRNSRPTVAGSEADTPSISEETA